MTTLDDAEDIPKELADRILALESGLEAWQRQMADLAGQILEVMRMITGCKGEPPGVA